MVKVEEVWIKEETKEEEHSLSPSKKKAMRKIENIENELESIEWPKEIDIGIKMINEMKHNLKILKKKLEFAAIGRWECSDCGKKYVHKATLARHIKTAHLHQNFLCSICGRKLVQISQLPKHLATIHGDEKDENGKKYKEKYPTFGKKSKK